MPLKNKVKSIRLKLLEQNDWLLDNTLNCRLTLRMSCDFRSDRTDEPCVAWSSVRSVCSAISDNTALD